MHSLSNNSTFIWCCIQNATRPTVVDHEQSLVTSNDSYRNKSLFNYIHPEEEYDSGHSALSDSTKIDFYSQLTSIADNSGSDFGKDDTTYDTSSVTSTLLITSMNGDILPKSFLQLKWISVETIVAIQHYQIVQKLITAANFLYWW
jgi:hypothetical protein